MFDGGRSVFASVLSAFLVLLLFLSVFLFLPPLLQINFKFAFLIFPRLLLSLRSAFPVPLRQKEKAAEGIHPGGFPFLNDVSLA